MRVRLSAGEVVGVEVRERFQPSVPDERVQGLRGRIEALERELAALEDEKAVSTLMLDHVQRLLRQEESVHQDELQAGRVDPEAWEANYRYLGSKLAELKGSLREAAPRIEEQEQALADLRLELGRCESAGGVHQKDIWIDCVGDGGTLEVDYVVENAGWEPYYDLRARKDLAAVELAYRAKVFGSTPARTGASAEILLSTAQPQRGAQGPEAQPIWLALVDPEAPQLLPEDMDAAPRLGYTDELGYTGDDSPRGRRQPNRWQPPASPSPRSRARASRCASACRAGRRSSRGPSRPACSSAARRSSSSGEHYVVPALDPTVWLRGRRPRTRASGRCSRAAPRSTSAPTSSATPGSRPCSRGRSSRCTWAPTRASR